VSTDLVGDDDVSAREGLRGAQLVPVLRAVVVGVVLRRLAGCFRGIQRWSGRFRGIQRGVGDVFWVAYVELNTGTSVRPARKRQRVCTGTLVHHEQTVWE